MIIHSFVYAKEKHEEQKRIGGEPYINHPVEVARILEEKGYVDARYIKSALFHDLFEDTDATEQEVYYYGGKDVLLAVKLLTKVKGYIMKDYIKGISQNMIAKMVKLADRLHNLRCAVVANEAFRKRYIEETEMYYLDLAKGTDFEEDIAKALSELKATVA